MALKLILDALEDVDEGLRSLYAKGTDGKYVLDVEGGAPDPDSKARLAEFRDNNRRLKAELDQAKNALAPFAGMDPDELKRYREVQEQMKVEEEKKLLKEGKFDEIIRRRTASAIDEANRATAELKKSLAERDGTIQTLTGRMAELTVDREVTKAIEASGLKLRQGALDDVVRRARDTWRINKDGQMEPVDREGKPRFGGKGEPLTMEEFVKSDLAEKAAHLFESAAGGGAAGGKGPGVPGKVIDASDPLAMGRAVADIASGKASAVIPGRQ